MSQPLMDAPCSVEGCNKIWLRCIEGLRYCDTHALKLESEARGYDILSDKTKILAILWGEGAGTEGYRTEKTYHYGAYVHEIRPYREGDNTWFEVLMDDYTCMRVNSRHVLEVVYKEIT